MESVYAVEMKNVTKTFGKVVANHNVSMTIKKGEILSVLGENGSGKTTLMNMLAGIYFPDSGKIYINGKEETIRSPKDAHDLHIGMIHQHFKLIDVFSAWENIVLGLKEGSINKKVVEERIKEICDTYGFEIDPNKKVYQMSVSEKQTLEIVKVIYRGADILILDEPTAVLTPQETEKLFKVLRNMKKDGKAVVIITHKLHEVLEISDRVTILRKGEYAGTVNTSETNELALTEMMVGRKVELNITRKEPDHPKIRLKIENLTTTSKEGIKTLDNVSFEAHGGEILGIAGVSGCGEKELLEAIAGLQKVDEGSITFYNPKDAFASELVGKTPKQIKDLGVSLAFVPEDRLGMGLVGSMGMSENMMLRDYKDSGLFFVNQKKPKELAKQVKEELGVVTPSINTPVKNLSGGNVQKVLVGREIANSPSVLMTAYAVRGLDINTSYAIYDLLNQEKEKGVAVIYVGEDLDVLLALCDKILVLCAGKMNGIVDARTTTKEEVGLLMTNLKKEEKADE